MRNLVLWPGTSLFSESSYCLESRQIYLPNGFYGRIKQHKEWSSRRDERNDLRSRINVLIFITSASKMDSYTPRIT